MRLLVTDFRWMNCWRGMFKRTVLRSRPDYWGDFFLVVAYSEFGYTHPDNADGEESYNCRIELGLLGLGVDFDFCVITQEGVTEDTYYD